MNTTQKTSLERASLTLFIISFIVYSIMSMTKNAFAASMASIVGEGLFSKSAAGIINASFYFFYGSAQLLGARLTDNISPFSLITLCLCGSIVSLTGMAFSHNYYMLLFFWSLCGLTQFALWPSVLRIVANYLLPAHQDRAKIYISFSYCIGMLLNYFSAFVILGVSSWRMLFIFSVIVLVLGLFSWVYITGKIKPQILEIFSKNPATENTTSHNGQSTNLFTLLASSGMLILLVASFSRSSMDLGIKSWLPTMMSEVYGVSPSFASILTTLLLLVNLCGIFISAWLYPKRIKSAVLSYGITFLMALPFTAMLLLIGKVSLGIVVFCLTIVTTLMYSGHQFINVIIPAHFARFNKAGSVASIVNAIACYGAVISNIVFGYLAEEYGWNITIASWVCLAIVGFISCLVAVPKWNKFINRGV